AGLPPGGRFFASAPRDERDLIGHHECGIETYAKLANKVGKRLRGWGLLDTLAQLLRPGLRDGADVGDQFVPAHSNAVITDGQSAGRWIGLQADLKLLVLDQIRIGKRFKPQTVNSIRSVGDKLPQENLPLG